MSVKRSKSGTRVLDVLERIAGSQPIGVSELARVMAIDKSGVQRAVMTLADEGWIAPAPGTVRRWQLTGHIHLVAHMAQSSDSLRRRALPVLSDLRDETGESAFLTVPDIGRFVVVEAVESRHLLRTAPHVGMVVASDDSATGRAVLPFLSAALRADLLGCEIGSPIEAGLATTCARGFSVGAGPKAGGSVNIAAPVFERDGHASAAIGVSAPRDRLLAEDEGRVGAMVLDAARKLSLAWPERVGSMP